MQERVRQLGMAISLELDSRIGDRMINWVLGRAGRIQSEVTFAERIKAAIVLGELNLLVDYSPDSSAEPISVFVIGAGGTEVPTKGVFLAAKPGWFRRSFLFGGGREGLYLYQSLRLALQKIDEVRRDGYEVWVDPEIKMKKHR